MKIVLYVNSFLPSIGGREIVVHYLASEFKKMGHKVRVVGPSGWWKHRKLKFSYPVHRWPTLRGFQAENVYYLQILLDVMLWGADIIHAHSTYPCGYTISRINKLRKIPLIVTPHGEDIHVVPEICFGLRLDPDLNTKIKLSLNRAQCVTAISKSVIDSLHDAGVGEEKTTLIPNGIDIERFKNKVHRVRTWLKVDNDCPIILTVGRYHIRKGFEILLKAMPEIIKKAPNAVLVIVGETNGKLEPLVSQFDLSSNVRLTGEISFANYQVEAGGLNPPMDKLAGLYQESAIYVSAAIEEGAEGLSLAMLDGMAAGLPIVASEISGNKDLIRPHINGLLVPPRDENELAKAIVDLLSNNNASINYAQNNRDAIKDISWPAVANQYMEVYRKAMFKKEPTA